MGYQINDMMTGTVWFLMSELVYEIFIEATVYLIFF